MAAALGMMGVMAVSVAAAAPNVATGSGITVDGSFADWTEADFFANMHRAGDATKQVESKLYLRYDCATDILFVRVDAVEGVTIPTNNHDNNFVKFGQNDKKVDGNSAPPDGTQPEFAYAGTDGWEASFSVGEGSITDLNVHAQVENGGSQTSAVADRAIPMTIDCPEPLTQATAAAAGVGAPSCTAVGTLTVPANTASVTYTVTPAYVAGATGTFKVTASAAPGFVLTGPSEWTLAVASKLTDASCVTGSGTLPGNPTPSPSQAATPTRSGTLASSVPNTAMDPAPINQVPAVVVGLVAMGGLAVIGRRNFKAMSNRR
jgi:hypothetical protein